MRNHLKRFLFRYGRFTYCQLGHSLIDITKMSNFIFSIEIKTWVQWLYAPRVTKIFFESKRSMLELNVRNNFERFQIFYGSFE